MIEAPAFLDYRAANFWLEAFLALCAFGAMLVTIWSNRNRATKESIEQVRSRVEEINHEVTSDINRINKDFARFEALLEQIPDHEDLAKIYERMAAVEGNLHHLMGNTDQIKRSLEMINTFLLNKDH